MNDTFDDDDHAGLALFMTDSGNGAPNAVSDTACSIPGKIYLPQEGEDERRRIDTLLSAYYCMLNVPPKKSRRTCVVRTRFGQTLAAVDRPLNVISRTFGQSIGGILHLQPEEWLLFFERGSLIMYYQDEQPQEHRLDGLDIWPYTLGAAGLDLDLYRGYAHLRRLGYVAVCHKDCQDVAKDTLEPDKTCPQQRYAHRLLWQPAFSY
ncbi:tRNA splicing endonuclease 54, partial [Coemansia guatemalensis]